MKRLNLKYFIDESSKLHNNIYDYSKTNYLNKKTKVEIICPIHGSFYQTPDKHLYGRGCNLCGMQKRNDSLRKSQTKFIEQSMNIHGDRYDYSKVRYARNHDKIEVICKKHGSFFVTANNHLTLKRGCPKCIHRVSKPEIEFLEFLKIPIGNRQVRILKKQVDGYNNNIIYEFLGDYYHGNPSIYDKDEYNPTCKKFFGELYNATIKKFQFLKNNGYNVKYIWESDWNEFKSGKSTTPRIFEF